MTDNTLKPFATRLPAPIIDLINDEHVSTGRSIQRIVCDIISDYYAVSMGK